MQTYFIDKDTFALRFHNSKQFHKVCYICYVSEIYESKSN